MKPSNTNFRSNKGISKGLIWINSALCQPNNAVVPIISWTRLSTKEKIHAIWFVSKTALGRFIADNWAESLSLTHFETMKMNGRCDTTKYIVDYFYMHQGTFHDVHWWCWVMIIYFNNTRFSSFSKNTSQ